MTSRMADDREILDWLDRGGWADEGDVRVVLCTLTKGSRYRQQIVTWQRGELRAVVSKILELEVESSP
jgi:hypothetical protein